MAEMPRFVAPRYAKVLRELVIARSRVAMMIAAIAVMSMSTASRRSRSAGTITFRPTIRFSFLKCAPVMPQSFRMFCVCAVSRLAIIAS